MLDVPSRIISLEGLENLLFDATQDVKVEVKADDELLKEVGTGCNTVEITEGFDKGLRSETGASEVRGSENFQCAYCYGHSRVQR